MTKEEKDFIDEVLNRKELDGLWEGEYVNWDKVRETALYCYKLGKTN